MHSPVDQHQRLRLWAICLMTTLFVRCACTNGEAPPTPPPAAECGGSCAQGEVCVAERCLPATCASSACNASEACLDGKCVARTCVGVQCPDGQVCAAGLCQPRQCTQQQCGDNQACVNGQCQQVRCVGQSCPAGEACANGACLPEQCPDQGCAAGQVCSAGTCVDSACVGTTCPPGRPCSAGVCSPCDSNHYEKAGECVPKQANGAACTAPSQCSSGQCVDEVCCESACDGACQACSPATGTCAPVPPGAEDPKCATYDCGTDGCLKTCQSDAECRGDASCISGQCKANGPLGSSCVQNEECASGQCVDNVCCGSVCDGACDACNLPGSLGTCTLRPASAVCRASAGVCDEAETCTGSSSACPPDLKKPSATVCREAADECDATESCTGSSDACPGDNAHPAGTSCGPGEICTSTGQCAAGCWIGGAYYAAGAANPSSTCQECNPSASTTSWSPRPVNTVCGTSTTGSWGTCDYSDGCDEGAFKSRSVTDYACSSAGTCEASTRTEREACARDTDGDSCGTDIPGDWSECDYSGLCDLTASKSRDVTSYKCSSGTCGTSVRNETVPCTRNTDGTECLPPQHGNWSACDYSDVCDRAASQSRSVTTYTCAAGNCASTTAPEHMECSRNTTGTLCDDSDLCTTGDACNSSGTCGGAPVVCNNPAPSQCQEPVGICSASTGQCHYAPKPAGATCDDGDDCTSNDFCRSNGTCRGIAISCSGGAVCSDGACLCPPGTTRCNGQCIDTDTDENNCGGCGLTCSPDRFCNNGTCICRQASQVAADGTLIPACPHLPVPEAK